MVTSAARWRARRCGCRWSGGLGALERYAWVDDALDALAGLGHRLCAHRRRDRAARRLPDSRGHAVAAYSGELETARAPAHRRRRCAANALKAVVATSALGMGYDKPDLGFCIHVGSPDSPVAYYQQVGRAGRAIDDAEAVLLPAESDERIWEYFATAACPTRSNVGRCSARRPGGR